MLPGAMSTNRFLYTDCPRQSSQMCFAADSMSATPDRMLAHSSVRSLCSWPSDFGCHCLGFSTGLILRIGWWPIYCSGDGTYFAQDVEKADQYTRDGDSAFGTAGLEELCVCLAPFLPLLFKTL